MVSGADGVLQGLIELAEQGIETSVTIQIGDLFIAGRVATATAYRAALTEKIGREIPPLGSDESYLHLFATSVPGFGSSFMWYRCPLTAVQGLIVHSAEVVEPTPAT